MIANTGRRLWLCLSLALANIASVYATDLREVELLIESGATTLAVEVLDREQAGFESNPEQWLEWENQRVKLYQYNKDWTGLIQRLQELPGWAPADFRLWAQEQVARAQIEQKDTPAALQTLRHLIWSKPKDIDETLLTQSIPVWRQLVIQAYLVAEQINDAEIAMLRFQQDHENPRDDWKRSRATVLIRAGKPHDAEMLMEGESHMHSRTIFYLAQLLTGKVDAEKIRLRTAKLAAKKTFHESTRRQFWFVSARAAQQAGKLDAAIEAMQNALILQDLNEPMSQREKLLFAFDGDDLWAMYEAYGRYLGNQWQLLIGNDEAWFSKASNLVDKQPRQAMALFAVMTHDMSLTRTRMLAHELFSTLLSEEKNGLQLVKKLYLGPSRQNKVSFIPEGLRHRLIDDALADSDVNMASKLIQTVTAPPKGANVLFWKLRKARIMILAGQLDQGIDALYQLLQEVDALQPGQMDRVMQVLFDLQTVGRHKEAIELFHKLPLQGQSGQMRREILYWIADSYKAQKLYHNAARYYLLSAGLLNSQAMDPWAQTARYQAADALFDGREYDDAGRIYKRLLDITTEPSRKVVLRNKIQQIWLQSNQGAQAIAN